MIPGHFNIHFVVLIYRRTYFYPSETGVALRTSKTLQSPICLKAEVPVYIKCRQKDNIIYRLWSPRHLEHPKTSQHAYVLLLYWHVWVDLHIKLSISNYQPVVRTTALKPPWDMTTHICLYASSSRSVLIYGYESCVGGPAHRTSEDITTNTFVFCTMTSW